MRPLTSNEKKLVLVFGVLALLIGNVVIMRWLSAEIQSTRAEVAALTVETSSLRLLSQDRPYWEARSGWLDQNQPPEYQGQSTDSEFAERVQRETRESRLTIESQQLLSAERTGNWVATPIDLTLRGSLESVVRWLQSVQGPGKFISVQNFNLRQSDDGTGMILRVRLRKLFKAQEGDSA